MVMTFTGLYVLNEKNVLNNHSRACLKELGQTKPDPTEPKHAGLFWGNQGGSVQGRADKGAEWKSITEGARILPIQGPRWSTLQELERQITSRTEEGVPRSHRKDSLLHPRAHSVLHFFRKFCVIFFHSTLWGCFNNWD